MWSGYHLNLLNTKQIYGNLKLVEKKKMKNSTWLQLMLNPSKVIYYIIIVKFLEDNTIVEGFRFSDMEHDNSDPIALKMV